MKKTILIITSIIVLIALATAYYILILTPQKRAQEQKERTDYLFSKKQGCQEAGINYFQGVKDSEEAKDFNPTLVTNAYNEKLNTCVIYYMLINNEQTIRNFLIYDSLSGKPLLIYRMWMLGNDKLRLGLGYDGPSYVMTCDDSGSVFKTGCSSSIRASIESAYTQKKAELLGE